MLSISELQPFSERWVVVRLPASRIIGRETLSGGDLGNTAPKLWDAVYTTEEHLRLEALPQVVSKVVSKELFGWIMEFDAATQRFTYMVGALTPADTPVPTGFTFRDVPQTLCAVGLYGEDVAQTLDRAAQAGYEANWDAPGCDWNAEMYFHAEEERPPKVCAMSWHCVVPIRAK